MLNFFMLCAVFPIVLPKGIMLNAVILRVVLFIVMLIDVYVGCRAYIGILSGMFILLS
jgi:hypothetical protein